MQIIYLRPGDSGVLLPRSLCFCGIDKYKESVNEMTHVTKWFALVVGSPITKVFTAYIVIMAMVGGLIMMCTVNKNIKADTQLREDFRNLRIAHNYVLKENTRIRDVNKQLKETVKFACVSEDMIYAYITSKYTRVNQDDAKEIAKYTIRFSRKYNTPVLVVLGVMEVESGFNKASISYMGARGLMQVMFTVWGKTLDIKQPHELHQIDKGIEKGILVINHYLKQGKYDLSFALNRYVGGDYSYIHKVYETIGKFIVFSSKYNKGDPC